MNKNELSRSLAKQFDLPLNKTNDMVSAVLDNITKSLVKGKKVSFVGFGSFTSKKRAARKGRNPQTGEALKISARKVVAFSAGNLLKRAVNKKRK